MVVGSATLALAGCASAPSGSGGQQLLRESVTSPAETKACLLRGVAQRKPFGRDEPAMVAEAKGTFTLTFTEQSVTVGAIEVSPSPSGSRIDFKSTRRPPRSLLQVVRACSVEP